MSEETAFRLMRTVGGVPHVADVALRVEPSVRDEVAVSDEAFAWRREVHGPAAASGGADDRRMVAEAIEGAWYVLRRRNGDGRRVTVTMIRNFPTDTGVGDVKLAAVTATCRALGIELDRPPLIEATGVVFPD